MLDLARQAERTKTDIKADAPRHAAVQAPKNVSQSAEEMSLDLASSCWLLKLDIGREKGTWMPQSWGRSGR